MVTSDRHIASFYERSKLIFSGKVVAMGTSNVRHITAAPNIATVRVEAGLSGNDLLRNLVTRVVTVVLDPASAVTLATGSVAVFFANGVVYADTVAVRAIGTIEPSQEATRRIAELRELTARKPLEQRVASATLILVARVVGLEATEKLPAPRSLHNPEWWIAKVLVISVVQGQTTDRGIDVLFARSRDIAWYRTPKLHAGDSGVLLLHRLEANDVPRSAARTIYQIIDPLDFLPVERVHDVRIALEKGRH